MEGPAYRINSVDNALKLLGLLRTTPELRLSRAAELLGVANSTAHRLLAMLAHHGFVVQDPATKAYRPGPALFEIGLAVARAIDIREQARRVTIGCHARGASGLGSLAPFVAPAS